MGIALRVRGNNQKTAGEYLRKAKEHRCRKTANPENKRLILPVAAHKSAGRTEYQPTRYSESRFSLGTVAQHLLGSIPGNKMRPVFSKGTFSILQRLRVPFRRGERFRITR